MIQDGVTGVVCTLVHILDGVGQPSRGAHHGAPYRMPTS